MVVARGFLHDGTIQQQAKYSEEHNELKTGDNMLSEEHSGH